MLHQKESRRFICLTIKGHIQERFSRSADNKALMTFYELAWNNGQKKFWNINCSLACAYFWPWLQLLGYEQLWIQSSSVIQLRLASGRDSVQDLHMLASGIIWVWQPQRYPFLKVLHVFLGAQMQVWWRSLISSWRSQHFGKSNCFDVCPSEHLRTQNIQVVLENERQRWSSPPWQLFWDSN